MSRQGLGLPERTRRYRFALTPLADVMFQLLIFFMLATNLTPYSLITLRSAPNAEYDEALPGVDPDAAEFAQPSPDDTVLWTVANGLLSIAGTSYEDPNVYPALAAQLGGAGTLPNVVLIVRDTARVQDVATVLEALNTANIQSVRIAIGGSP